MRAEISGILSGNIFDPHSDFGRNRNVFLSPTSGLFQFGSDAGSGFRHGCESWYFPIRDGIEPLNIPVFLGRSDGELPRFSRQNVALPSPLLLGDRDVSASPISTQS